MKCSVAEQIGHGCYNYRKNHCAHCQHGAIDFIKEGNDNFFLFLVNCCFLQYVTELFVYCFYPFIALEQYKKILGDAFYYDEDTDILIP